MSLLSTELTIRSESRCELCNASEELNTYIVAPKTGNHPDEQVAICDLCLSQVQNPKSLDPQHWRCLNESMWSTVPAVQVLSYRMMKALGDEAWAQDLLNMMYMDETTREWADAIYQHAEDNSVHKDSNGNILQTGDTVVLIKDLDVKGANFIAKRGTSIRRINLVHDNPEHIEGRVNDQNIVILTKFVKKSL
ncbi:MAG: PhnA domain-containing protein [Saprospiraceae bacterium]